MKWKRLPGEVFVANYRGCSLIVTRTIRWIYYGGRHGKEIGDTWRWQCFGNRLNVGIAATREQAQQQALAGTWKST